MNLVAKYQDFLAAKTRKKGESDQAYVERFLETAQAFVDASAVRLERKEYGTRLDAVDVADLMGDPDIEIAAPHITMEEIAVGTKGAIERIDVAIARVRNNAKVALLALASAGGAMAGGAPATAVLPAILGAAGKLQ